VGFGGHPDLRGVMSLDASIMDGKGNCGAVAAVEGIMHPVSMARVVKKHGDATKDILVCFLATNRSGEVGAWSTRPGFEYTLISSEQAMEVIKVGSTFQ